MREHRDAGKKQGQQQQGGTDVIEDRQESAADDIAQHTPCGIRKEGWLKMERRQPAPCSQRQQETGPAQAQCAVIDRLRIGSPPVQEPPAVGHHDGRQVGEVSEQEEEQVREPGAGLAAKVAYSLIEIGLGPAGIGRLIGEQRQHQVGTERNQYQQNTFAQPPRQGSPISGFRWLFQSSSHRVDHLSLNHPFKILN